MSVFHDDWDEDFVKKYDKNNTPLKAMADDFNEDISLFEDLNILYASYTYEGYEGSAFVLYEKDGTFFEVNGGHCSCYGLEGQWNPDKVSFKEMKHRLTKGTFGRESRWNPELQDYTYESVFADELLEVINKIEEELLKELEGE